MLQGTSAGLHTQYNRPLPDLDLTCMYSSKDQRDEPRRYPNPLHTVQINMQDMLELEMASGVALSSEAVAYLCMLICMQQPNCHCLHVCMQDQPGQMLPFNDGLALLVAGVQAAAAKGSQC